jgi:hypothetical protein
MTDPGQCICCKDCSLKRFNMLLGIDGGSVLLLLSLTTSVHAQLVSANPSNVVVHRWYVVGVTLTT